MKSLKYPYTQNDLLKFPEKYQHSEFQGIEFLSTFKQSREDISIHISKNISILQLSEIYPSLSESRALFIQKDMYHETSTLLISCLINDDYLYDKKAILEKILKNFEINKKIFSNYEFFPFNHSENFSSIENYALFSLICAKIYDKSKNLKFLNTILKLNDILSSRINSIDESITLSLVYHAINYELNFIDDLLKTKVENL